MMIGYIDPGTGSMLISAGIALFSAGFFMIRGFIYRGLNIKGNKSAEFDLSKEYDLVFYSEGKQYWNVFKPLIEECIRRSISVTYLTSDKLDPGLDLNTDRIRTQYIGSGREAYFILNRLIADMVVMTTPGLDVLQIKRSKHVKHYTHITHAPGCVGGYKSFALDYYDSVLIGNDLDISIIKELEVKRNLKTKQVKVIGHTYLDLYREKIIANDYKYHLFTEKRPNVLISPTWSNHGLLTKYGVPILDALDKSDLFNVIIRPHPQSLLSEKRLIHDLMEIYPPNENRVWDTNVDGLIAMSHADIMISDFSGIIFDFLVLFGKPILTMNSHYEKRGRDAIDLTEDPWDLRMVEKLGQTIDEIDLKNLTDIINSVLTQSDKLSENLVQTKDEVYKYPGESANRGVDFIVKQLDQIKAVQPFIEKQQANNNQIGSSELALSFKSADGLGDWIKKALKIILQPSFVIQIYIACILLSGVAFTVGSVLPEATRNQKFFVSLFPYSLLFSFLTFLVLIGLTWLKKQENLLFYKKYESIEFIDLLLVALPMTPIVQYIIANQDILSFIDSILVFGWFLVASSFLVVFIPWILSGVVSKNLIHSISLSLVFVILNMANFQEGIRMRYIAFLFGILTVVIFVLLFSKNKKILASVILVFFIVNAGFSIINKDASEYQSAETKPESKFVESTMNMLPSKTPDVFLLTYESYSNQETMDYYGFDNSDQIEYLRSEGFTIYDGTYTVGPSSAISIANVLQSDIVIREYREIIARESSTLKLFDKLNYVTHSIQTSDYMTRGYQPNYDFFSPAIDSSIPSSVILSNAILEGEFRFDVNYSSLSYESYIKTKRDVLAQKLDAPEFIYTHNNYPGHSQNSGILRPEDKKKYYKGIEIANAEMKLDLEALDLASRDAVVVIIGDHGPYLTKNGTRLSSFSIEEINRMDIQDRYGAFLAISWPDSVYEDTFDIQILQDIFPAIISYMYDDVSLFDKTRMARKTLSPSTAGGVVVKDGIIHGGIDDGKPLFENTNLRLSKKPRSE